MRATLNNVTKVKSDTDAVTEIKEIADEQAALAAGIRELGNPDLDELARALESNVQRVEESLTGLSAKGYKVDTKPGIDEVAVDRVRKGQLTGGTSIEKFAASFGVDPASPR